MFYILISLLLLIALALTGDELSLDAILSDTEIRTDTVFGWTLALVWLVNAVIVIPVLVLLVQRAKLVLDFVLTLEFIHLIFVWIHTRHFPTCGAWWILQTVSTIVMTLGGEWACMRRELEPILVSKKPAQRSSSNNSNEEYVEEEQQQLQPGASSSLQLDVTDAENEPSADWVHIAKKKRKTSDPSGLHNSESSHSMPQEDDAPLTRAVGKAKRAIMQSAQRATTKSKGKRYETIPMSSVDASSSERK